MVLSSTTSGGQQPVLSKLQQTFAFLKHTMRAIYSPSDFLKAARPPWFEAGRQQDCSEFIKYLLDTLQEQEKCGRKGATTYREHCVIEPPKITTTEATVNSSNEEQPMEVKNSFSTNALDSISEAPETSGNADVDMLSQVKSCLVDGCLKIRSYILVFFFRVQVRRKTSCLEAAAV